MCTTFVKIFNFLSCIGVSMCLQELSYCHADISSRPADGAVDRYTFPWLGFIQYVKKSTKMAHHLRAPRVVLVHKQFVITTANEMVNPPKDFKLGDVVFGEYEQDEIECHLPLHKMSAGIRCPDAYLVIPHVRILIHSEYSRFDISNSLALVKLMQPVKSEYMVPICLPTLGERMKLKNIRKVFMVDYLSAVPQNFNFEKMAKRTARLFVQETCKANVSQGLPIPGLSNVLCTNGCGVRPGAPLVTQTRDGRFELIGLAASSGYCNQDHLRTKLSAASPLYIDIYRYLSWIVNIITAEVLPQSYPHTFRVSADGSVMGGVTKRTNQKKTKKHKGVWYGHMFAAGDFCFDHTLRRRFQTDWIYSEKFRANVKPNSSLYAEVQVNAGIQCIIGCARLKLPFRIDEISIVGLGGFNVTVSVRDRTVPEFFIFELNLEGHNVSKADFDKWSQEHSNYRIWA